MSDKKPANKILQFEDVYPLPRSRPNPVVEGTAGEQSGAAQDSSSSGLGGDLTAIDLYCLHCGYNLRGLSGDPRRCPECGKLSSLSEMTLPAQAITAQLRRMKTWPTLCIGFVLLLMVSLGLSVLALVVFGPTKEVCAGLTLPVLILVPLWFHGVTQFSSSCMEKPGWVQVLIEYHIYGVGLCLLIMMPLGLPSFYAMQRHGHGVSLTVILVIVVAAFAGVVTLAPLARRRCKAKMDALQRDVAVKLAGEYLRRRLSKGRR